MLIRIVLQLTSQGHRCKSQTPHVITTMFSRYFTADPAHRNLLSISLLSAIHLKTIATGNSWARIAVTDTC